LSRAPERFCDIAVRLAPTTFRVFADIKKKHSAHAITADVDIVETAKAAEFFQADGVIVSAYPTGQPADAGEVESRQQRRVHSDADWFGHHAGQHRELFVGSGVYRWFFGQQNGMWANSLEERRVEAVARAFGKLPAA